MNWKKLLVIAAVVGAFAFVSAPKSEAHVSIGIGIGLPLAYPVGFYGGYAPYGYGSTAILTTRPTATTVTRARSFIGVRWFIAGPSTCGTASTRTATRR